MVYVGEVKGKDPIFVPITSLESESIVTCGVVWLSFIFECFVYITLSSDG